MTDERSLSCAKPIRPAEIADDLDFIKGQLARIPTRKEPARLGVRAFRAAASHQRETKSLCENLARRW
jgi:hypothetical protein